VISPTDSITAKIIAVFDGETPTMHVFTLGDFDRFYCYEVQFGHSPMPDRYYGLTADGKIHLLEYAADEEGGADDWIYLTHRWRFSANNVNPVQAYAEVTSAIDGAA